MKLWIALFNHRHGTDTNLVYAEDEDQALEKAINSFFNYEPEREDEDIEVRGPFDPQVPNVTLDAQLQVSICLDDTNYTEEEARVALYHSLEQAINRGMLTQNMPQAEIEHYSFDVHTR